jgi:hypothetical protein
MNPENVNLENVNLETVNLAQTVQPSFGSSLFFPLSSFLFSLAPGGSHAVSSR